MGVDIWAIGVLLYYIAIGILPFDEANCANPDDDYHAEMKTIIKTKGHDPFGSWNNQKLEKWKKVKGNVEAIKGLINELVTHDANKRPSAEQVMKSNTWLKTMRRSTAVEETKAGCCSVA